jgi:hypothetical protein
MGTHQLDRRLPLASDGDLRNRKLRLRTAFAPPATKCSTTAPKDDYVDWAFAVHDALRVCLNRELIAAGLLDSSEEPCVPG